MNGMTKRKSRYLTFRAVIHRAGPTLAIAANRMKAGRNAICQLGRKPYHAIIPSRRTKEIRKSMKATTTAAVGTISLGKYTLLIRFALPIKLFEASVRPLEK